MGSFGFLGGFRVSERGFGGFGSAADPQSPSRGPPGPPGDPRDPTDWKTVAVIGTVGPLGTPPLDPFWVHFGGLEPPFWGGRTPLLDPQKGVQKPIKKWPQIHEFTTFCGEDAKKVPTIRKILLT